MSSGCCEREARDGGTQHAAPPIGAASVAVRDAGEDGLCALLRNTEPVNLAESPALVIPSGFASGFPVGLQIVGPNFGEGLLRRIARAYQGAAQWHRQRPAI